MDFGGSPITRGMGVWGPGRGGSWKLEFLVLGGTEGGGGALKGNFEMTGVSL